MSIDKDIDMLYEIGTLRHVNRTWRQFGGSDFANVAEHMFRVAWLAMVIAKQEGGDVGKSVCMALAHDLGETRTGDANYLSKMYVAHNEFDAVKHSTAGTSIQDYVTALWIEYEERESLEAKIVKDADNLDCDLELAEEAARGSCISKSLAPTREAVFQKLFTPTARRLYEEIQRSDPHRWHLTGRNRLTAGDWKINPPPIQRELDLREEETDPRSDSDESK